MKHSGSISTCLSLNVEPLLSLRNNILHKSFSSPVKFHQFQFHTIINITFLHDLSTLWSKDRLSVKCKQNLQNTNWGNTIIDSIDIEFCHLQKAMIVLTKTQARALIFRN